MKTKPLTFLLVLTFLFLFSGSSTVVADELQDGWSAYERKDYNMISIEFLDRCEKPF